MTTPLIVALLIAGAVVLFTTGLIFIILGSVLKSPRQWIPGLIMAIASVALSMVAVMDTLALASEYTHAQEERRKKWREEQRQKQYDEDISGTATEADSANRTITGFAQIQGEKLIYLRIKADGETLLSGISPLNFDSKFNDNGSLDLDLKLHFSGEFTGRLELMMYDRDNLVTASAAARIDQKVSGIKSIRFTFAPGDDLSLSCSAILYKSE